MSLRTFAVLFLILISCSGNGVSSNHSARICAWTYAARYQSKAVDSLIPKRFFSSSKISFKAEEEVAPWYVRFVPAFVARKRGFIPLAEFERVTKQNGELETKLAVARSCIQSLNVINDLRFDAENRITKYWILTPRSNDWREDAVKSILTVHPDWEITTPAEVQSLNPPARQKLFKMYDDTFLKWVYTLFNSQYSGIVNLRKRVTSEVLIQIATNATYVMMVAHASSHKILLKNVLGLKPVDRKMIVGTLKDDYGLKDREISDLLIVLGKEE